MARYGMKADGALNGWAEANSGGGECWVYVNGQLCGPDRVHSEPNRLFLGKFESLIEEWITAGFEDKSMAHLAEQVYDQPPTDDERRVMEGSMAEWHAADLTDVSIYEEDMYSERIKKLAEKRPGLFSEDGEEGHWRIIGGHQGLAEHMAKGLDITFESVVEQIAWGGQEVSVKCKNAKAFTAKTAVVTLPLACIPDVAFRPTLPADKLDAVATLGRGITTTVYLRFREQFWPEKMAFLFHGMSSQCFWPGRGKNVLTAYFGGKTASAQLLALSDEAMAEEIVRQLSIIFSKPQASLRALLLSSEVHRWDTDEFAKMSYSYCPVGTAPKRVVLGAPCGNLFWAGEATHPTKGSFAHGALEEGERAADEVIEFFGS